MRDFVAGVFGGMCGVVAGQPLDFVRVRLQTASHTIESPLMLLRSAIRTEGIRAVWKGMTSPIFGVSFQNAITFVSYGQAMHMLSSEKKNRAQSPLLDVWLAGTFAGLCQSVVVCPVELVKIKLQMQRDSSASAVLKGPWHCARLLFLRNGVRGLFQGFGTLPVRTFLFLF
jgi:solute carrier family 25 (mitochondrial carnitine/acylcarnitine transporter), member 20/29